MAAEAIRAAFAGQQQSLGVAATFQSKDVIQKGVRNRGERLAASIPVPILSVDVRHRLSGRNCLSPSQLE